MPTVWLVMLAVFTALLLFALTRAPHERRILLPGAIVNLLFAASQIAIPNYPVLGFGLMVAALVITAVGIFRMGAAARRASFTGLRAPLLMGAGAILCIVIAELLPNGSRWMTTVLTLMMILTAGFMTIGVYRVTRALFSARARRRTEA